MRYVGLLAYVVAQAVVFVPMLFIANHVAPGVIQSAGMVTMLGFAGLTGVAMWTKKDFCSSAACSASAPFSRSSPSWPA